MIGRAYCINLDSHIDDWHRVKLESEKWGIPIERFPAVAGKDLDINQLIKEKIVDASVLTTIGDQSVGQQIPSINAIGCSLSHISIWKEILRKNEIALVLEDDVVFEGRKDEFERAVRSLPQGWDLAFLGYEFPGYVPPASGEWTPLTTKVIQAHCYLLHPRGAKRLLQYVYPIVHQVDMYMAFQSIAGHINGYFYYTKLADTNRSVLESTNQMLSVKSYLARRKNWWYWLVILIWLIVLFRMIWVFYRDRKVESGVLVLLLLLPLLCAGIYTP